MPYPAKDYLIAAWERVARMPQQFVGEVLAICPGFNVWQSRRIRIMGGVVAYPPKSFGNIRNNIDGAHARRRLNESAAWRSIDD